MGNTAFEALLARYAHFSKFLLVGSFNTAVDIGLYFVFADLLSINPILSNILSTSITMCMSFFLNHRFVFRSNKRKRHTALQFILITLFNAWVVQSLIIGVMVHSMNATPFFMSHVWTLNLVAKFCGVAVSFILNFIGYRYIFTTRSNTNVFKDY